MQRCFSDKTQPRLPSPQRSQVTGRTHRHGFTLIELLVVIALVTTLVAAAVPFYTEAIDDAKTARATADISLLAKDIAMYQIDNEKLPGALGDIGRPGLLDPYGNPYEFLNFATAGAGWKGQARKDRFLVPLNSDYDLYSKGRNGISKPPLTAIDSQDDIVRANDGGYIGLAAEY